MTEGWLILSALFVLIAFVCEIVLLIELNKYHESLDEYREMLESRREESIRIQCSTAKRRRSNET